MTKKFISEVKVISDDHITQSVCQSNYNFKELGYKNGIIYENLQGYSRNNNLKVGDIGYLYYESNNISYGCFVLEKKKI